MSIKIITARMSPIYAKVSRLGSSATSIHALSSVLLVALAAQGIPYLAVHSANVMSSVELGQWLIGGGAVLLLAAILSIYLPKSWMTFLSKN